MVHNAYIQSTSNINMYIQNKCIQIHKNQSVVINLMKVSIFDLVKPSMLYISHFANKSILSSGFSLLTLPINVDNFC